MTKILIFTVVALGIGLPGLRRTQQPTQPTARITEPQGLRSVNYGGVSFDFYPLLAMDVKAETIPASLDRSTGKIGSQQLER